MQGYIADLLPSILHSIKSIREAENHEELKRQLAPWLAKEVAEEVGQIIDSRELLKAICKEILQDKAELYVAMSGDNSRVSTGKINLFEDEAFDSESEPKSQKLAQKLTLEAPLSYQNLENLPATDTPSTESAHDNTNIIDSKQSTMDQIPSVDSADDHEKSELNIEQQATNLVSLVLMQAIGNPSETSDSNTGSGNTSEEIVEPSINVEIIPKNVQSEVERMEAEGNTIENTKLELVDEEKVDLAGKKNNEELKESPDEENNPENEESLKEQEAEKEEENVKNDEIKKEKDEESINSVEGSAISNGNSVDEENAGNEAGSDGHSVKSVDKDEAGLIESDENEGTIGDGGDKTEENGNVKVDENKNDIENRFIGNTNEVENEKADNKTEENNYAGNETYKTDNEENEKDVSNIEKKVFELEENASSTDEVDVKTLNSPEEAKKVEENVDEKEESDEKEQELVENGNLEENSHEIRNLEESSQQNDQNPVENGVSEKSPEIPKTGETAQAIRIHENVQEESDSGIDEVDHKPDNDPRSEDEDQGLIFKIDDKYDKAKVISSDDVKDHVLGSTTLKELTKEDITFDETTSKDLIITTAEAQNTDTTKKIPDVEEANLSEKQTEVGDAKSITEKDKIETVASETQFHENSVSSSSKENQADSAKDTGSNEEDTETALRDAIEHLIQEAASKTAIPMSEHDKEKTPTESETENFKDDTLNLEKPDESSTDPEPVDEPLFEQVILKPVKSSSESENKPKEEDTSDGMMDSGVVTDITANNLDETLQDKTENEHKEQQLLDESNLAPDEEMLKLEKIIEAEIKTEKENDLLQSLKSSPINQDEPDEITDIKETNAQETDTKHKISSESNPEKIYGSQEEKTDIGKENTDQTEKPVEQENTESYKMSVENEHPESDDSEIEMDSLEVPKDSNYDPDQPDSIESLLLLENDEVKELSGDSMVEISNSLEPIKDQTEKAEDNLKTETVNKIYGKDKFVSPLITEESQQNGQKTDPKPEEVMKDVQNEEIKMKEQSGSINLNDDDSFQILKPNPPVQISSSEEDDSKSTTENSNQSIDRKESDTPESDEGSEKDTVSEDRITVIASDECRGDQHDETDQETTEDSFDKETKQEDLLKDIDSNTKDVESTNLPVQDPEKPSTTSDSSKNSDSADDHHGGQTKT